MAAKVWRQIKFEEESSLIKRWSCKMGEQQEDVLAVGHSQALFIEVLSCFVDGHYFNLAT